MGGCKHPHLEVLPKLNSGVVYVHDVFLPIEYLWG
jgi:hypothetical protein